MALAVKTGAVSRNAVIGRARRLGLPALKRGVRNDLPRRPRKPRGRSQPMFVMELAPKPQPVVPLNIPYFDLEPFHCREIVGTGEDGLPISCGHPRVEEGPWFCVWHTKVNFDQTARTAKPWVYWPTFGKRKMVAA